MQEAIDFKFDFNVAKPVVKAEDVPILNEKDYQDRIKRLVTLANEKDADLTHLLVYGDREHYANLTYLCGFDPRFEEALLLINLKQDISPILVVGMEGMLYADIVPLPHKRVLYESFGLMGQTRGNSPQLKEIYDDAGIDSSSKVGILGWKGYTAEETPAPERRIEIPNYIVEELTEIVPRECLVNRNDLLMSNDYGLRQDLDHKELVLFEIASSKVAYSIFNVIKNLRPGITEMEASEYLAFDGLPLFTHPNINFGIQNVRYALASPTYHKKLEWGEPIGIGGGYRRSQCHRFGIFAKDKDDLPDGFNRFIRTYFLAMAAWFETIGIGVSGGEMYDAVLDVLGSYEEFGVSLNPGHQIHLDEWNNTIFYEGSKSVVTSGMALQADMIALPSKHEYGAHLEDGIIVADEAMREQIRNHAPSSWERIVRRRAFMKDVLGINLKDEILPVSDMTGVYFPYMSDTSIVLRKSNG